MTKLLSPNIDTSSEGLDTFIGHVEVAPNVFETRQSPAGDVAVRLLGTTEMGAVFTGIDARIDTVASAGGPVGANSLVDLAARATALGLGAPHIGRLGEILTGPDKGRYSWDGAAWVFGAIDDVSALTGEIGDARDGNATLEERLAQDRAAVSNLDDEIAAARDGAEGLSGRLDRDYNALAALRQPVAEQQLLVAPMRVGKQTVPVASASKLNNGVCAFPTPLRWDGSRLVEMGFRAEAPGTIIPQSRRPTNNTHFLTRVSKDETVAIGSAGLKVLTPADFGDVYGDAGDFGAFWCSASMVALTANANGTPYLLVTTASDDDVVEDASEARNYDIEAYQMWEGPQHLQARLSAAEVDLAAARGVAQAVLGHRHEAGFTGVAGALAEVGTSASAGHIMLVGPEPFWRVMDVFRHVSPNETWATFWVGTKSGLHANISRVFKPVKIEAGLNQHTWLKDIALAPGEMLGMSCHTSCLIYTSPGVPPAGYRGFMAAGWTALAGNAFSVASVQTAAVMQARLEWRRVMHSSEAEMLFAERGVAAAFWKQSAPAAGASQFTAGTAIFPLRHTSPILADEIQWVSGAASDVRWSLAMFDGTDWVIYKRLDDGPKNYKAGENSLYFHGIVPVGAALVGQGYTAGWLRHSALAHPGWQFKALPGAGVYPDTISPPFTNNGSNFPELRLLGRQLGGESHTITRANSDKIAIVGPSYVAHPDTLPGKPWTKVVSEHTDWPVEALGFSGEPLKSIANRLRTTAMGSYPSVSFGVMGVTYAVIMEAINSSYHDDNARTFDAYKRGDAPKAIETVRGDGAQPIWAGEGRRVYGEAGHAIFRTIAERAQVPFIDVVGHALRFDAGTKSNHFWQGLANPLGKPEIALVWHYGIRGGRLLASPNAKWVNENLYHYRQGYKAYRLRAAMAGYSDAKELLPRSGEGRRVSIVRNWDELAPNHTSLGDPHMLDRLTGFGAYSRNQVVQSEYLRWQLGQALAMGPDVLLDYVLDTILANCDGAMLTISDPSVSVYAVTTRPGSSLPEDVDESACDWVQLSGTAGVYLISRASLPGLLHGDRVTFRLHKPGGMTITEPRFTWFGKPGKPRKLPPTSARVAGLGPELLAKTSCETLVGWEVEGSPAASTDDAYQVPYGRTGFIPVTDANRIKQTIPAGTDNFRNRTVRVAVECQVEPIPFTAGTWPDDSQITPTSWDDRELLVELIAPDGTVFDQHALATPWGDEAELFFMLPMRVGNCKVRVSAVDGSDPLRVFNVSVREVTAWSG